QEVGLAETHGRVDVERVIAAPVARRRVGDLHRARMRHAVRCADDEALEGIAWIERGALEAADAGAPDRLRGRENAGSSSRLGVARTVDGSLGRNVCRLPVDAHAVARARLAQNDLDLLRTFELGAAASQEIVGIVRLD